MNRIMTLCAALILACLSGGANVFAQSGYEVKGVIVDPVGPVIGATVIEQGTTNGTSTGLDGDYVLTVSSANAVIEISCIGYASQTFVASQLPATVTLTEDTQFLDEVVVIGYGTVKKEDMTGSVATVEPDAINKGLISSPADLLKGKSAGVVVTPGSGQPGSGSTIRIRGGSSLRASNDPLIIIDGLPVSNDAVSGMSDALSSINPNDIESFSVLKDASATAIYGSRASNGVIVITTKKGAKTSTLVPQINFDFSTSLSHAYKMVDVLTGDQVRDIVNSRVQAGLMKQSDADAALGTANTDWQKEIYQLAPTYEGNLSFSGRVNLGEVGNLPYRVSGGLLSQDGILKTDSMNRGTLSLNLSPSFFDNHLTVNLNGKGVYSRSSFANTGAIGAAIRYNPTLPVYDKNGLNGYQTHFGIDGSVNTMATENPVAMLMEKTDKSKATRFIGNAQFDYKFHGLEDLRFNLNLGMDWASSCGFNTTPIGTEQSFHGTSTGEGYYGDYYYTRMDQTLEAYLAYNKDFNGGHHFDAMAGYSWQHFWSESRSQSFKLTNANTINKSVGAGELYLVSFFGRLNYSYDNRYMITATLRRDGTSRFQNNKWGLFPSVALGWNIANESFLKDNPVLTTLKLRASWGQTGQQAVGGYYDSLPIYTDNQLGSYYYFGDKLIHPISPLGYNAALKWETTTSYNVGFDFGFLDDRITAGVDAYVRKTTDLLNKIAIPAFSNLTNMLYSNIGSLVNKGVEFNVDAVIVDTKDWTWSFGANASYNQTKITKLTAVNDGSKGVVPDDSALDGGTNNYGQIHQVGYAPNTFFLFKQVYDENCKPIEGVYVDMDGNGEINDDDKYYVGKPAPDWTVGFNTTLSYKNWTLAASGHGSFGQEVFNNVSSARSFMSDLWTNNFLNNRIDAALDTNFEIAQYHSDYYLEDASFFKFDNITLGYTFPKLFRSESLDRNMGLNIFATVQNVATITKYSGLDPEIFNGIDKAIYPRPRIYMLGFKLNF